MSDWLNPTSDDTAAADPYGGDAGYLAGGHEQPAGSAYGYDQPEAAGDPYAADPYAPDPYAPDPYAVEPYATDPYAADPYGGNGQGAGTAMAAAPASPAANELSVQAPYLEDVAPSRSTIGGNRGDLSSLVLDVEVPVEVFFGDASLTVEEFLELGRGSVVELDHAIEAPIELRVRGKLVARGQLVTISGNYGLRITETVEQ